MEVVIDSAAAGRVGGLSDDAHVRECKFGRCGVTVLREKYRRERSGEDINDVKRRLAVVGGEY